MKKCFLKLLRLLKLDVLLARQLEKILSALIKKLTGAVDRLRRFLIAWQEQSLPQTEQNIQENENVQLDIDDIM